MEQRQHPNSAIKLLDEVAVTAVCLKAIGVANAAVGAQTTFLTTYALPRFPSLFARCLLRHHRIVSGSLVRNRGEVTL